MDLFKKMVFTKCASPEFPSLLESLDSHPIKPSAYMEEMMLTTQQRLEKLKRNFLKCKTKYSDQLDIIPNVVVFQNYKEDEILSIPMSIVNSSKTSCCLSLVFTESPFFTVTYTNILPDKLAPGMELHCYINFSPQLLRDYKHQMKIVTNNKEYVIPIIAIGPVAILNLPDNIILPNSFVHIGVEKVLLVKNLGEATGIFNLLCEPPFYVKPLSGTINPNECMQVTIRFKPENEGESTGTILVKFDSGNTLIFTVKGTAECTDIILSPKKVYFDNTYIGLHCQKIIQIHNKCDQLINFTWKKFNSNEQDKIEGDKMKENLIAVRESETRKSTKLETFEIIDNDINDKIYKRIYDDEVADFDKSEHFLYNDLNFVIIPEEGEIWPNHTTDISLIFKPTEVRNFHSEAYCKVTGRNDRLALNLYGTGIGPKFILNIKCIDLDTVYLFSEITFEIVVCNNGSIPGTISFVEKQYDFENEFSSNPVSLELIPFEHGVFIITLIPHKEGLFIEEIHFMISDSKEIVRAIIKGNAKYAQLEVEETSINFGYVSVGEKLERTIQLFNNTYANIPYECSVIPDGISPAVIMNENLNYEVPINPRQFTCIPEKGVANSSTSFDLTIQLMPCRKGNNSNIYLCIDIWDCTKCRLKILLSYIGILPEIICNPSLINIRSCFINYLFERVIVIKNKTHYIGYVSLIIDTPNELKVTTNIITTIINPYEIIEVTINIVCTELGKFDAEVKMCLFGGDETTACNIVCFGQGPNIVINPQHLHFGEVQLLKTTSRDIILTNDSPIPAEVAIETKKDGPCTIHQASFRLKPEESKTIEINIYLNDNKKYTTRIFLTVSLRGTFDYKVTAIGVGTAIDVEPSILPKLDLDALLTNSLVKKTYKVTNKGVRFHKIIISKKKEIKSFQTNASKDGEKPVFSIEPKYFTLAPDQSINMILTCQSDQVLDIEEPLYFHAIIEGKQKKQIIIETTILCKFVIPEFQYSKSELSFRADHYVDKNVEVLLDAVIIKNITPLKLEADIQVKTPFLIDTDDDTSTHKYCLTLDIDEESCLRVFFEPPCTSEHCIVIKSQLIIKFRGHIKKDVLKISGVVNYPNVKFFPSIVQFGYIIPGGHSFAVVELRNVSPIKVAYKLDWLEAKSYISYAQETMYKTKIPVPEIKSTEIFKSSQPTEEILEKEHEDKKKIKGKGKGKGKETKKDKEKAVEKSKDDKKEKDTGKKLKDDTKTKGDKKAKGKDKKEKEDTKKKDKKKKEVKLLPVENIYQHYYTESYLYYSYIQISDLLFEPTGIDSLICLSEQNKQNLCEIKQFLYSTVEDIFENNIQTVLNNLCKNSFSEENIDRVLNVIPARGVLDPYESQNLYISFYPDVNCSVSATLLCQILNGPVETLHFHGAALDVHYEIETTFVDFGRQTFSEITQKKIKLKNSGLAPFTFHTSAKEKDISHSTQLLEVGFLTVQPRTSYIEPFAEVDLTLNYFPGIGGKFTETFEIEIEYYLPVTITATGYGGFPQIYLNLVRPSLYNTDTITCYEAIASLSSDFLSCLEYVRVWTNPEEENFTNELPKIERRTLQKDGWSIVSYNPEYPSPMDIELAIERTLAYKQLIQRQSVHLNKLRNKLNITAPSYRLDFGVIVINTVAHYPVLILNYGPSIIKIRFTGFSPKQLAAVGFEIQFKQTSLQVGDTTQFYILFSPVSEIYKERYYEIQEVIYLQVLHGMKIPIEIKAIVTKPFLASSTLNINFGTVVYGNIKKITFLITNMSLVTCIWKAHIEMSKIRKPKDEVFFLNTKKGHLSPGHKTILEVTFDPIANGIFNAKIIFKVEQNEELLIVKLYGIGSIPWLIIDKEILQFESTVPYAPYNVQYFSIQNQCDYPIEYIFSNYDTQILDEEKLRHMLCEYYGKDQLLIPERYPGSKLPYAFYKFGENIFKTVTNAQTESTSLTKVRKTKKRKEGSMGSITVSCNTEIVTKFLDKSESFLINLIQEFSTTERNYDLGDPLLEAKIEATGLVPVKDPNELNEGILFIFYGAPLTDYLYAANRLARQLKMPVYNINDIICEALAYSCSLACFKINKQIDDEYNLQILKSTEEKLVYSDDPYVTLRIKLDFLISKFKSGEIREKAKGDGDKNVTFLGIQEDLFKELLAQKLSEYKNGIVIETLNNDFIRQPIATLMCLLYAVRNLRYIHFVLIHDTIDNYKSRLQKKKQEQAIKIIQERMEILDYFDRITEDEFNNLSPEYMNIYRNVYIAGRKTWLQSKLEKNKDNKTTISLGSPTAKSFSTRLSTSISTRFKCLSTVSSASTTKSRGSSKKSKKTKVKEFTPEEEQNMKLFESFEKVFNELAHWAEYWDRTTSILKKVFVPKSKVALNKKDAEQTKKKKTESESSPVLTIPIVNDSSEGYPFWIIKNSNIEVLLEMVKHDPEFQEAYICLQQSLIEVFEPETETLTNIYKPIITREQEKSSEFTITKCIRYTNLIYPEDEEISHYNESNVGMEENVNTTPISNSIVQERWENEPFVSRDIIEAGEKQYYCVFFRSDYVNYFEFPINIEPVLCGPSVKIICKANCDTPRINTNPKIMFPRVIKERTHGNKYLTNVYIEKDNIFDFGNKIVQVTKDKVITFFGDETAFNIENISLVPCYISIHLVNNSETFKTSVDVIFLRPYDTTFLILSAIPSNFGEYYNTLLISIKDNPRIEVIHLLCTGCQFEFELSKKKINFERILQHHSESKTITLINKCAVPVNWRILNCEVVTNSFLLEPECGYIKPFSESYLNITYLAPNVEILSSIKLFLQVFHEKYYDTPLLKTHFELNAETCDLLINCPKDIHFGHVKIKTSYQYNYKFYNNGKYNILFEIEPLFTKETLKELQKPILEKLEINTLNGVLVPQKETSVIIIFSISRMIKISEYPLARCNLLDHGNKKLLSSFFITLSAKSSYSKFIIYPTPELNFGTMLVGATSKQILTITNTGKVDFNYTVLCKRTLEELQNKLGKKGKDSSGKSSNKSDRKSDKSGKKSNKSEKKSDKSDKKSNKSEKKSDKSDKKSNKSDKKSNKSDKKSVKSGKEKKVESISCGPYLCKNSVGNVIPNEKAELEISCKVNKIGKEEEMLIIFISESLPKDKLGKIINLKVSGYLPEMDYENYELIFGEHFIVEKIEDFIKPKEAESHCVFSKSNTCLTFNNTCINTVSSGRIQLFNNGLVESVVEVSLTPATAFKINPKILTLPSYSNGFFTVEFHPKEIQLYNSTLEFVTVMPYGYEKKVKSFSLMGEGKVPQITIKGLNPLDESASVYRIIYNPTLIGKHLIKSLIIANSGDLSCKVIIEICDNCENVFSIQAKEDTIEKLNCQDIHLSKFSNMLKLMVGDVGTMHLKYEPKSINEHTCLVKIHVVNNPYETITINVFGESFAEDIFIDELPTTQLDTNLLSSISNISLTNIYGSSYVLDFKEIYPKTLHKRKFKIINRSNKDTFKFVFRSSLAEINFIPAIGHLKPNIYKIIIATFISEIPVIYEKIYMDCLICKINYVHSDELEITSWDDRERLVVYDEHYPWRQAKEFPVKVEDLAKEQGREPTKKGPKTKKGVTASVVIPFLEEKQVETEVKPNDKLLDEYAEPEYEIVEDSIQNIPIFFSSFVDYPSYECSANKLEFADTFLFDKRVETFSIFNNGYVNLELSWIIVLNNFSFKQSTKSLIQETSNRNIKSAYIQRKTFDKPKPLSGKETFIGEQCVSTESLYSSEASLHVPDKWYMPFTIDPENSLIKPQKRRIFTLVFAPLDVFQYKVDLKGIITNAAPEEEKIINVEVLAKSLAPCCHFDVELSDYISSGRRKMNNCDFVIDEFTTKVIEINCLGVGIQHTKTFNIVNPTDDEMQFSWHRIKSYEINSIPLFDCYNVNGLIEKGKVLPVTFSVLPQSIGIFEAIYNFKIEKYDITMPFLFVANVRKSDVRFLYSYLILKPVVLGTCVSDIVILKNNENVDLNFKFKKSSLYSEGRKQYLAVEPLKGIVPKKGEVKIKVSFSPNDVGEVSFTPICVVEFSASPILLSVSTKCYEVQLTLICVMTGKKIILNSDTTNTFNFEEMLTNNEEKAEFIISNVGRIGFYYNWNYNDEFIERNFNFDIYPKEGYVKINTEVTSLLSLTPIRTGKIRNFKVDFHVKFGPTFKILIHGSTSNAFFKFSFMEYNFGPCLIQQSNNTYHHTILEFFNGGFKPITLDCTFLNTDYLNINFKTNVVPPKTRQLIDIFFTPKTIKQYSEDLVFIVNAQKIIIKILGEGIPLEIVLVNIVDKEINLGSPQVGATISRSIKVINKSTARVDAFFDIWDRLPIVMCPLPPETHFLEIPQKIKIIEKEEPKKEKIRTARSAKDKKSKKSHSPKSKKSPKSTKSKGSGSMKHKKRDDQQNCSEIYVAVESPEEILRKKVKTMISFSPKMPITILPNKTAEFTIHYTPTEKIQSFLDKISVQVLEIVQPLCNIKGACLGPEFYFDRDEISFGAVVVNCVRQTKLILLNEGDVSSKLTWTCNTKEFSITPMEAYSSAGLPVSFMVKYHPSTLNIQSIYQAECVLKSFNKPLYVKLIGLCAAVPPATETVRFSCPVRNKKVRSVSISNNTNLDWELYPEITGDYFSCTEYLLVLSKDTTPCEITYEPFQMTKNEDNAHKGFLFLKRPDGEAITYDLIGIATRPEEVEIRTIEFPCKTNHKEIFNVYNWSRFKQQFKVYSEDNTPDISVNVYEIKGLANIEVLGQSEREYEWYIYVYKECSLEFNVIFMNDEKEYLYYRLKIKVHKSNILESIKLETCIRSPITYGLLLINPLSKPITYKITSNSSVLSFSASVEVASNTEITENIIYNPLLEECSVVRLEATCAELGTYLYEFKLNPFPPIPEESIHFSIVLGEKKIVHVNIQNLTKTKATFFKTIEKDVEVFNVDDHFNVAPNQVSDIKITICPYKIGNIDTVIKFCSPTAGDFIFPVFGKCIAPVPKGPYTLHPGKSVNINFFNPFPFDEVFFCTVKPNVFTVNLPEELVLSKSVKHITVTMEKLPEMDKSDYPIAGKLIIFSKTNSIKWAYYLNGIV